MKNIPRYWAYVEIGHGNWVWRCSSHSEADAKLEAEKAARKISVYEKARNRSERPRAEDYPYGVSLREKLLMEIRDSEDELQGFITRNQAGAKILNVGNVMFLDWDTPHESPYSSLSGCLFGLFNWIGRLFGGKKRELVRHAVSDVQWGYDPITGPKNFLKPGEEWLNRTPEDWEEQYPWAAQPELSAFMRRIITMPEWGVRIYKTAAGYRGIVTHDLFSPTDPDVIALMNEFGCDPLYILLCKQQESFRVRLSPKGWHCGLWNDKLAVHFRFQYPFAHNFVYHLKNPAAYLPGGNLLSDAEFKERFAKYLPIKKRYSAKNAKIDIEEVLPLYLEQYEEAEKIYETTAAPYASARYLGTVGVETIHPEVAPILELHDTTTEALTGVQKKLA